MFEYDVSVTVLNFSGEETDFHLDGSFVMRGWLMGSYDADSTSRTPEKVIKLRPWEGLMGVGHVDE